MCFTRGRASRAAAPRHRRGILASMASTQAARHRRDVLRGDGVTGTSYCESSARPARLRFWRARATRSGPLVVMSLTSVSATVPAVM